MHLLRKTYIENHIGTGIIINLDADQRIRYYNTAITSKTNNRKICANDEWSIIEWISFPKLLNGEYICFGQYDDEDDMLLLHSINEEKISIWSEYKYITWNK